MSTELPYKSVDLTDTDFRGTDLSGQVLAHSNLTNCKFGNCAGANFVHAKGENLSFEGSDITGSTFERADESVLRCLIGAVWNGQTVTHVSDWITKDHYWCFATNAFVQCGCMQKTLEKWQTICKDEKTIEVLHDEQPDIDLTAALAWWRASCDLIEQTVSNFKE